MREASLEQGREGRAHTTRRRQAANLARLCTQCKCICQSINVVLGTKFVRQRWWWWSLCRILHARGARRIEFCVILDPC